MDIAIIGFTHKLAPDIISADDYWDYLLNEKSSVASLLYNRNQLSFNADSGYATLLNDPLYFDHKLFSLSPSQSACLDPSQRLLLMLTHELYWQSNILSDDKLGLFISTSDSGFSQYSHPDEFKNELATGTYISLSAGRVARHLKISGPVLQLDSASSSSLLTVHYAINALLNNECTIAFAGGVNIISHPSTTARWYDLGVLSSQREAYPFSTQASGFVRGEGGAIIALRPLDLARDNNDPIYGIIKASSVVQDWYSDTLTSPSVKGEEKMLSSALQQAEWNIDDLDYLEAHGSGTPIGDTIELTALNNIFAKRRQPLPIGSVKGHLGHLENAAGIVGLIKILLIFAHQKIPATLTKQPLHSLLNNSKVLELITRLKETQINKAGITSLGMSGTQVHLLLERFSQEISPLPAPNYFFDLSPYWPESTQNSSKESNELDFMDEKAILNWLCQELYKLIGMQIKPDLGMFASGLTSLQANQLRQTIQKYFHARIPPTIIFNHPSPNELARKIYQLKQIDTHSVVSNTETKEKDSIEKIITELEFEISNKQGQ